MCSCEVAAHRFSGATEPDEPVVRIPLESMRLFVEDLRVMERNRRGEAGLTCPELRLKLSVVDSAGHVQMSATLSEFQLEGMHQVTVGFPVYATDLPRILQDFEDLLTFPQPSNNSAEGSES